MSGSASTIRQIRHRIQQTGLLAVLLVCAGLVSAAEPVEARIRAFENGLGPAVRVQGEPPVRWTIQERMAHWNVPGLSIAVIRDGKIAWAKGYGVLQAGGKERVDTSTVFSVGSVSKVGAAAMTLRLVDAGQVDLDRDVNDYLARWQVPQNMYTAVHPVTLRGILSHSAGLTLHGFPDFLPGEALPTVIDTLEGREPARTEPVRVVYVPGSRFRYSGGGTTVEQLVIEEVTGLKFTDAARRYVFEPLGMSRSTYENPLPAAHGNIAKAHGDDGRPGALPRGYEAMPEMAASGLWTTPSDYSKLVIAFIKSYQGDSGGFLSTALAREMMTEVGRSRVGLGPFLDGQGLSRRFSHGGANNSYKAWMEGHLGTGDGMVILTNGSNGDELYTEVRRAVALVESWGADLDYQEEVPAIELSAAELEERAGVYLIRPPGNTSDYRQRSEATAYRVVHREGGLYLSERANGDGERLIPVDASRFLMVDGRRTVSIEFMRDYAGEVNGLSLRDDGSVIEADKVGTGH